MSCHHFQRSRKNTIDAESDDMTNKNLKLRSNLINFNFNKMKTYIIRTPGEFVSLYDIFAPNIGVIISIGRLAHFSGI